jgi:hypothetical protein
MKLKGLVWLVFAWALLFSGLGNAQPGVTTKPETFLLNAETLAINKTKIKQGDQVLGKALGELTASADKALGNGPYSVTYKTKVPPSGDKHDYMSVGPYWWPDSSKADGLPYIRRDGRVNPERYSIKDADFHGSLCEDVYVLAVAWFFTGDEKYAEKADQLLKVWFLDAETKMNPNLNFGQAIPGRVEGRGIGIIDTRNLAKLIDGVQLLKGSKSLSTEDYEGIRGWYKQFLTWMTTSPIGLDEADEFNNHGTWYDVQTVSMALFTGQKDLAKQMLEEQTEKRIDSQLKEDGSQPHELARTLSWNYSAMNLTGFFELARLGDHVGVDLWNYVSPAKKSLRTAFVWMLPYATGKKKWEYNQIKAIHFEGFTELARMVSARYPNIDISGLPSADHSDKQSLFLLTGSTF